MQFRRIKKPADGKLAKQAQGLPRQYEGAFETELAYWDSKEKDISIDEAPEAKKQAGEFIRHLGDLIRVRDEILPSSPHAHMVRPNYNREALGLLALSRLGAIITEASLTRNWKQEEDSGFFFEFPTKNAYTGSVSDARLHMTSSWIDELVGPPKAGAPATWFQASDQSLYLKRTTEAKLEPAFTTLIMEQRPGATLPLDSMQTLFPYLPKV